MNNQNAIEILGGFNNARKRYASGKQIDRDRFDTFSKAIEMAIESLEITNRYRWIPVEERLPEANMIQREDGKILVADPASVKRSNQEWELGIVVNEARRGAAAGGPFWVFS